MDTIKLTPELVTLLRGISKRQTLTDAGNRQTIASVSEGDVNDAYAVGVSDGEALLARRLLASVVR